LLAALRNWLKGFSDGSLSQIIITKSVLWSYSMSNKNKTKAQLIELLTEKGISAQMSMKKDELLLLLETNNTPDVAEPEPEPEPEPEKQSINVQATKGNQSPMENTDASQPSAKMLIIGAIVLLAIIYFFVFK
jgi:hypothetical protein